MPVGGRHTYFTVLGEMDMQLNMGDPRLLGMFLEDGYVYIFHAGERHRLLSTLL